MGSAISNSRSDTMAHKSNESFEECEQFRGRLQLRTDTGQWKKYEITFDGTQITCPLWTILINDILVISTLKCKNQSSAQCLCIRTINEDTIILRGKNPEEIERWAFVLQKICSLTKMVKEYKMMLTRKQKVIRDANVPVAKQYANTMSGGSQKQRSRSQKTRSRAERRAEQDHVAFALLTDEKSDWINTWRQSLTDVEMEMMVPDLTSLPDNDEQLSIVSGMTSISMRGRSNVLRVQEKSKENTASLKGCKSLPNLRPKSSSRALVSERRRGTSDYPENSRSDKRQSDIAVPRIKPSDQDDVEHELKVESHSTTVLRSTPMETNDDTSTIDSAPPRTPSRRLSSPLNKQASESMPIIRCASNTLSDAPSLQYISRHHLKKPSYAQSGMI